MSQRVKVGTIVQDENGQHWLFTGNNWRKIRNEFKRRVEARLFMDNKGQVRGWTSDWLTNEKETEHEKYFVRWLSQKMVTNVTVTNNERQQRAALFGAWQDTTELDECPIPFK